jgi:hypothetical protein
MHISIEKLAKVCNQIQADLEIGSIYFHYKNSQVRYKILQVGILEASEEPCVIYQSLYEPSLVWVRSLASWRTPVEHNGQIVTRFQKVQ